MPKRQKQRRRRRQKRRVGGSVGNEGRPIRAAKTERKINRDMLGMVPIFPVSRRVNAQRYYDYHHELTGTAGAVASYVYSANGLFDPDISGTGHQPMGFDQMMLFYEQGTVIRSRIKVTFCNTLSTYYARYAVYVSPDGSALSTSSDILENGLCSSGIVSISTGAGNVKEASMELDIAKYFGRSGGDIVNDANLHSTAAANPVEQVYYVLAIWSATSANTSIVGYDTLIEYDVVYHEPRKVAGS